MPRLKLAIKQSCKICGKEYPRGNSCYREICRKCYSRNRYLKNRRAIKEKYRNYYYTRKEKSIQNVRDWQARNKEKVYLNNRNWRKRNPEKIKEIERKYNPIKNSKRRARLKNNGGSFTTKEWEQKKKEFDYTCAICGEKEPQIKLTVDHIIPLNKNGVNSIDNIQPLCIACNIKKSDNI